MKWLETNSYMKGFYSLPSFETEARGEGVTRSVAKKRHMPFSRDAAGDDNVRSVLSVGAHICREAKFSQEPIRSWFSLA